MSWMSENYHKAALGAGVAALAGVGYLSWSSASAKQSVLEEENAGRPGEELQSEGGELAGAIADSLKSVNPIKPGVTKAGRQVDLFNSVDLFVQDGDVSEVIDLLQVDDVHDGIPNDYWVKNRVDPTWSDSPDQDKDGDGFTNGEEFFDETDPSDPKSYGLLASKLEVKNVDSTWWLVLLNSSFGNDDLQFRYKDSKGNETRMRATDNIVAGQNFFPEGPAKNRFKAVKPGEREVTVNGRPVMQKYYIIEDLAENKKGQQYEAAYRPRRGDEALHYQFDNTVTFILNAIGQQGTEHTVRENESFTITADGKKLTYKLVKVDMGERPNTKPVAVHVEYLDDAGAKQLRKIALK
ncbi:MAG: Amuc_1099 family pilus-like system protein [Akkermansiaceae bacterium]